MTMTINDTPRVWVGCLACYNAQLLHGEWFDATDAPEDMTAFDLATPYNASHVIERHEELWVFDHENFHGLLTGECSPATAKELAEQLEQSGNPAAYGAYANNVGRENASVEDFEEAFCGEYESGEDYAQELAEETGAFDPRTYGHPLYDQPGTRPDDLSTHWPFTCIDWEHAWRELEMGGDYYSADAPDGGVYIFRSI